MNPIKLIKDYRKLGKKEFWKRFKEGAENITPTQKTKGELMGNIIVLIGITLGLIITPIIRIEGVWFWVFLILLGSFLITILQLIGTWQRYTILKRQDEIMKRLVLNEGSELHKAGVEGVKEELNKELNKEVKKDEMENSI